ncbi:MAG: lysostaphin resistance A-like protein [Planctomycetota bacterium]|jgi:membrane protease YdiL (CAAX protease family)
MARRGSVVTVTERSKQMSVIKYGTGEVRVLFRVVIAVALWLAVVFVLRFIPIFVYTAIQAGGGMARQEAVDNAKAIVFEHAIWSTVIGIINGLMSLPIVWFLMRVIEKRMFTWKEAGLDWRRNSLLCAVFGAGLALFMYVLGIVVDRILGCSIPTIETLLAGLTVWTVIRSVALWIPMGFGEEVIFRSYVQSRLVERHGALRGILIGSIVFTLLHLLIRPLSPVTILSGVMLWAAVGALYHWSRSLYLVGMFHGLANILLNTLPSEGSGTGGLIVNALALLLVVAVGLRRSRSRVVASNPG